MAVPLQTNRAWRLLLAGLLGALAVLASPRVRAQADDVGEQLAAPAAPERVNALRDRASAPVPDTVPAGRVDEAYADRLRAAQQLGDSALSRDILREWSGRRPANAHPVNELANLESQQGNVAEVLRLREQVLAMEANYTNRIRYRANLIMSYLLYRPYAPRVQAALAEIEDIVRQERGRQPVAGMGGYLTYRADSDVFYVQLRLAERSGRLDARLDYASKAWQAAKAQYDIARALQPGPTGGTFLVENARFYGTRTYVDRTIDLLQAHVARNEFYRAEQVAFQFGSSVDLAQIERHLAVRFLGALSVLRMQDHRFAEAAQYARRALEVLTRAGFAPATALGVQARARLLDAQVGQLRWDDAQAQLTELDAAAAANPALRGLTRQSLTRGLVHFHRGEPELALNSFQLLHQERLRTLGESYPTALAQGMRAAALAAVGQKMSARRHFDEAFIRMAQPQGLGEGYRDQGLNQLVRETIFRSYLQLLAETAERLPADAAQAFVVADLARASLVQAALSEAAARSAVAAPGLGDVVRRDQDAKNEILALQAYLGQQAAEGEERRTDDIALQMRRRIGELAKLRTELRAQILGTFPDYDKLVNPQPPAPAQVAAQLQPGEAFLSVFPAGKDTYVWLIAPGGGVQFHRAAIEESRIANLVKRLRASLDVADRGNAMPPYDTQAGMELYERLLLPAEVQLAGVQHLIVAAAGELAHIPFAALPGGGAQRWLVDRFALSHVPNASAWSALHVRRREAAGAEPFMGWGDPQFKSGPAAAVGATRQVRLERAAAVADLQREGPRSALLYDSITPLPETRDEILAIARTLKADASAVFLGPQASRQSVLALNQSGRLRQQRVLAFATHGLVAGDLPYLQQPALALAATGAEATQPLAPLLTMDDVLLLRLNADWVVLSACNTAAADGRAAEALSGLARGFFYAGARSILATHWAVESESARQLTTATFEHYAANPQGRKAESLRQAMLALLRQPQYQHPAYWAPYALVGDGGR